MAITNAVELSAYLSQKSYPGRGILLGTSPDGLYSMAAYFIMGRSENSRNRVFVETADGISTRAHDPAKLSDPSLIIYHPVRRVGRTLIVTNGDQTDTIRSFIERGEDFFAALKTRCFEPDEPNWTPRISGVCYPQGDYALAILKSGDALGKTCRRNLFAYEPVPGEGHLIHTYQEDGNPLPSFAGEPVAVALPQSLQELADTLWSALNAENKISLYVSRTHRESGESESILYNKNTKGVSG